MSAARPGGTVTDGPLTKGPVSNAPVTNGPVITAWSAVSPYGIGRTAYAEGLGAGRTTATATATATPSDPETAPNPDSLACLVPDFAVREVLGKAGTRTMDRSTGLAVTAVRELLQDAENDERLVPTGTGTALVLGTTLGSAQGQHDFGRASFEGDKPYDVPAKLMPNVLMNCPTAATAIWFGLKGPNATLAGGRPAGLLALGYARRLLAAGRAERALVGAVEEYSTVRSWLEHHSRGADDEQAGPLGEGCAMLLLEPADGVPEGRRALAEILAIDVRADVRDDLAGTLAECVEQALEEAGARPDEVWAAVGGGLPGAAGRAEQRLLDEVFGTAVTGRVVSHELIGDTSAASTVFQVAAVLAAAAEDPAAAGRPAVVTSVDRDGMAACAVLRLLPQNGPAGGGTSRTATSRTATHSDPQSEGHDR
ncbi:beta-ketoacyl synthase N-terminal-like domain-containing protein [Streptomyces sp. H27-D2]|uniref:beta-ketoacyl synthase N-terminal-like domain-containing protein n=1 Tax=Streptomyces sp. H27-D2 TaxID=3046304 RepID=UPI002DB7A7E7|nr:beta-ketoacyl synthase N-terminal-like domain-containing protein [Streptomyces sp. H27-D2]MEC4017532.1 beta-ketoacyl synthase N-terminal-like domain-containing protein [Streptomyces sp. H27-D2]